MKNFVPAAFIRLVALLLPVVLAACASSPSTPTASIPPADPNAPPKSILWVGNSFFYYNNSMHGHVGQLLQGAGVRGVRQTSATISGSGINWHDIAAHLKPGGVGSYSFVGDNEVRFNTFDRAFDAVIIMDCSQCPIHPKLQSVFHDYAKRHSDTVRANGANPVFFSSWAYQDKPEMTAQLQAEYVKAAQANRAKVIPAGAAFALSVQRKPDLNLYIADKRHPSLAGTYLGACVVMASLMNVNPVGNSYTAGLPPDVARHLQTVAWDAVQAFKQP
jgi:hypothetical protein